MHLEMKSQRDIPLGEAEFFSAWLKQEVSGGEGKQKGRVSLTHPRSSAPAFGHEWGGTQNRWLKI